MTLNGIVIVKGGVYAAVTTADPRAMVTIRPFILTKTNGELHAFQIRVPERSMQSSPSPCNPFTPVTPALSHTITTLGNARLLLTVLEMLIKLLGVLPLIITPFAAQAIAVKIHARKCYSCVNMLEQK